MPSRLPPARPTTSCSWRSAHSAQPATKRTASAAVSCSPVSRRFPELVQSVRQKSFGAASSNAAHRRTHPANPADGRTSGRPVSQWHVRLARPAVQEERLRRCQKTRTLSGAALQSSMPGERHDVIPVDESNFVDPNGISRNLRRRAFLEPNQVQIVIEAQTPLPTLIKSQIRTGILQAPSPRPELAALWWQETHSLGNSSEASPYEKNRYSCSIA